MDALLSTVFPEPQRISPVALNKNPVSRVASENYLKRKLSHGIAPKHNRHRWPSYCTTLPPSPKDDLTTDPACSTCHRFPKRPFKRDTCYMLYSPQQNIWGPVCGDGGYNANWTRGNRFGVDYDFYKVFRRPEYRIDGAQYAQKNPVIVSHSKYFPLLDFYNKYRPEHKTFPYFQKYALNGQSKYVYPYNILGKKSPVLKEGFASPGTSLYENMEGNQTLMWLVLIIGIIAVICLFYSCLRK